MQPSSGTQRKSARARERWALDITQDCGGKRRRQDDRRNRENSKPPRQGNCVAILLQLDSCLRQDRGCRTRFRGLYSPVSLLRRVVFTTTICTEKSITRLNKMNVPPKSRTVDNKEKDISGGIKAALASVLSVSQRFPKCARRPLPQAWGGKYRPPSNCPAYREIHLGSRNLREHSKVRKPSRRTLKGRCLRGV